MNISKNQTLILLTAIGTVTRYILLLLAIDVLFINIVAVIICAFTLDLSDDIKPLIHTGFLGGFGTLSAIFFLQATNSFLIAIIHMVGYYFLFIICRKLKENYEHIN